MANYVSSFTGAQIDDALLKSAKNIDATGTDTITGTFTGLTYTEGINVMLNTAGANYTTTVTVNFNSLGAKNVYKIDESGTKVALEKGEMPSVAHLYYDGTDFILINKKTNKSDITEFKTRKRDNLLPDSIALCEDSTLFTNFQSTDTNDSSNAKFGKTSIQLTLTGDPGQMYYNVFSLVDATKYYAYYGYAKKGTLTGSGARLKVAFTGGGTSKNSSYVTNADYELTGVVFSPAELSGASAVNIYIEGAGSAAEYAYFGGLKLVEITPEEYAQGIGDIDTFLATIPFTSSRGIETYSNITSLPDETLMRDGRVELELQGQSNDNPFGTFADSTAGWTSASITLTTDSSNQLEGGTCLKLTLTGASGTIKRDVLSLVDTSKYYMISAYVEDVDLSGSGIRIYVNAVGDAGLITPSYSTNNFYKRQGLAIKPSDFDGASALELYVACTGVATEYGFADAFQLDEITQEDYESLAAATDASDLFDKYQFHRGLKGTSPKGIENRGKNLATENYKYGYLNSTTGVFVSNANYLTDVDYIPVNGGETIKLNCNLGYTFDVVQYNFNYEFISRTANTNSVTLSSNAKFFRYNTNGSGENDISMNTMVEIGSTATNYKPFENSIVTMPKGLTLYSVPNGEKCSFNYNSGKHVQRVQEHALESADFISLVTTPTNVDYFTVLLPTDCVAITTSSSTYEGLAIMEGFNGKGYADSTANENCFSESNAGTYDLLCVVPKGTYADISAVRTALAGTIVHYQLATPITTYYEPQNAQAFIDGTQFKLNEIEETLYYDAGLTLESGYTPLAAIEVVKIDQDTNDETKVDLSTVTIGAATTISSASKGELDRIRYSYFGQGTGGILNYMYCFRTQDSIEGAQQDIKDLDVKVDSLANRLRKDIKSVNLVLGAISATTTYVSFIAPEACKILSVDLATKDAIAASDTDYWTVALTDKGSDGTGSDTIASKTTQATGGEAFAAYDTWNIGAIDATYSTLAKGDVVTLTFTKTSAPTAFAEALATISYVKI